MCWVWISTNIIRDLPTESPIKKHTKTKQTKNNREQEIYEVMIVLVYTILLPFSIAAELATLYVHMVLRMYKKTSGKIVMSLTTTLMVYDVLVIVSVAISKEGIDPNACKVFAIGFHWLLLNFYLWTAMMSHDIWIAVFKPFTRLVIVISPPLSSPSLPRFYKNFK